MRGSEARDADGDTETESSSSHRTREQASKRASEQGKEGDWDRSREEEISLASCITPTASITVSRIHQIHLSHLPKTKVISIGVDIHS
jgi:hypothetical protein